MWRSNIFPKIHILPNISRNKGNQTMKFGQLIGYNMKNIFLEKSLIKCGKRPLSKDPLSPDPFLKNQNWAYLWINSLKFYTFSFNCMPSWGLAKYIETKLQNTCFYLMLFFKKKKGLELIFLPHFLRDFREKYFSCYILLTQRILLPGCLYFLRYWAICAL